MIVIGKTALSPMLDQVRAWLNAANCRIRLYQNDYTPTPDSGNANYTAPTFPGYAGYLDTGAWAAATLNAQGEAVITTAVKVWTQTGPTPANTIYGYFVTTSADDYLWGERNPAGGVLMNAAGLSYTVYPQFRFRNDTLALAAMGLVNRSRLDPLDAVMIAELAMQMGAPVAPAKPTSPPARPAGAPPAAPPAGRPATPAKPAPGPQAPPRRAQGGK